MLGIFGTTKAKPSTWQEVAEMVRSNFRRRRLDLDAHELGDCSGWGWWLKSGTATVYIFVQDEPTGPVVRATSPILHFPQAGREQFFHRLLEINRDLSTCCLASYQEVVLVTGQRPIEGLDAEELQFLIGNVARVSDELDTSLSRQFDAQRYQENI